jgi:hypothetical protein
MGPPWPCNVSTINLIEQTSNPPRPEQPKMSKPILSPDETYLEIGKPGEFQRFYQQFIELLKSKLQRVNIGDSSHYYYTCSEIHDRDNKNWEPFANLWSFTDRKRLDFYVAKDLIEEHLGRQLECECEILGDKKAIRRRILGKQFGVDFGGPGERGVDIV